MAQASTAMEIEERDLVLSVPKDVDDGVFQWNIDETEVEIENYKGQYSVIRHKIASSPIVQSIYKLMFSTNKPLEGLESENKEDDGTILTSQMLKELKPTNDSYDMETDSFDELEGEMLKLTKLEDADIPIEPLSNVDFVPELEEILVTVQQSSIRINNESTFELPTSIRSSNVLKGTDLGSGVKDEDALLITLTSGFLMVIKFYSSDSKIKPYVVQWWKTNYSERELPRLTDVGRELLTHKSSSAIAVTAMKDLVRLYYCVQTQHGIMLDKLQNLTFDGTILHSCFLEPVKNLEEAKHVFFASLVVTSHRRYLIRLFEWWLDESRIIEHTPLLLTSEFDIPVFMLPFQDGVLMVMENKLTLITVNQILSADYEFVVAEFPGSFPVSYFKPESPLFSNDASKEVVIATEDGTVYSVLFQNSSFQIRPVLKISKITQFVLEKSQNGYDLLFASEVSSGGFLHFPFETVNAGGSGFPRGQVIDVWDNWAPIFDVEIVDKRDKSQELWIAHGRNLSKFSYGLSAEKLINDSSLRKAYKVFQHTVDDVLYFIFSFIDKTLIFQYNGEELLDIPDSGLDLISRTIHVASLENVCFQITENSIVISDFENQVLKKDIDDEVIFGDCFENFVCTVNETHGIGEDSVSILNVYQVVGRISSFGEPLEITERPNFVKFLFFNESLFIVIGVETGLVFYLNTDHRFEKIQEIPLTVSEPHDLAAFDNVLYITSRYGECTLCDISGSAHEISLEERIKVKLSNAPLELFLADDHIILTSEFIWKLELGSASPVPIIFKEQKDRIIYCASTISNSQLALLRDDGFCIASLSTGMGPVLKTIKLREVPKKIKYLSHLNVFAILTDSSIIFSSKTARLGQRLYSKKKANIFEDENPLTISQWIFPTSEKSFRNLLVGCGSSTGGCLKILQPKFSHEGDHIMEAYEIFAIKTDGPVVAAEQFDGPSIIYSSGKKLVLSNYDLKLKKMKEPVEICSFNSLVTSIDVKDNLVLVSTRDYSITMFRYEDGQFTLVNDDLIVRKVTNSVLLEDNVTVTTDKLHCCITGVQDQQNRFTTHVSFVPKLKRCHFMPNWSQERTLRFLAFGIGGDLEVYTLLNKDQTSDYKKFYKRSPGVPSSVTKKGLWEFNEGPWTSDRNMNTYDNHRFEYDSCPDDLKELLNSISI